MEAEDNTKASLPLSWKHLAMPIQKHPLQRAPAAAEHHLRLPAMQEHSDRQEEETHWKGHL